MLFTRLRLLVFILILAGEHSICLSVRVPARSTCTSFRARACVRVYARVRACVCTRRQCETMTVRMCACIHAYMRANGVYACAYVVSVAAVRQVRGTVNQSEASPWPGGAQPSASSITCVLSCRDITCQGGIVHRNKSTLAKYPFVCEEIKRASSMYDARFLFINAYRGTLTCNGSKQKCCSLSRARCDFVCKMQTWGLQVSRIKTFFQCIYNNKWFIIINVLIINDVFS